MNLYAPGTNTNPSGTLVIDNTPIINGTNGYFLYDNNGVVGEQPGGGGGSLTVNVTPISGGTAGYALTDNGGTLEEAPIRTLLTGNATYYVTTTGSDSNDGSSGSPWLTLQHAINVLALTLDFQSLNVTLNIGPGIFAGFGLKTFVGGGILIITGAGSASTTIINGPNDGVYNGGEGISGYVAWGSTTIYVTAATFNVSGTNCIGLYQPGVFQYGVPVPYGDGDIAFVGASGQALVHLSSSGLEFSDTGGAAGTVEISGNCSNYVQVSGGNAFLSSSYTISGTPAFSNAFLACVLGGIQVFGGSYTGSATGKRFEVEGGGVIDVSQAALGLAGLPGNAVGVVSHGGVYIG